MWTEPREPVRLPEDRTRPLWLVEQEKFRNSLKTFQTVSQELAARRAEFNKLFEETQSTRAETRALRAMLDKTAIQLGLQPLPSKEK